MQLSLFRVYLGRNLYSAQPCVHLRLAGLAAIPAAELGPRFEQHFIDLFDSIAFPPGETPGGVERPPTEDRTPAATVAWIAEALLRLTGMQDCFCMTSEAAGSDMTELVLPYREVDTSVEAVRLALSLLVFMLPANRRPAGILPGDYSAQRALEVFLEGARRRGLDHTALTLIRVAEQRDIPWRRITQYSRTLQLGHGRFQRRLMETVTTHTGSIAEHLSRNKSATVELLRKLYLPVPRHFPVSSAEQAERIAERLGFPVVVKPNGQGKGAGITVGIRSPQELRAALDKAAGYKSGVVVEEYIAGADHRALVVDGTMIALARRIPAHVTGDGSRSIRELVAASNRDPRRGIGFDRLLLRLALDTEADRILAEQGCTRDSVPAAGTRCFLRRTANISTGGTAEDATAIVHPDNRRMLERAARAIDLDICGVDFITTDISRSYREVGGAICEINRSPGLRPHMVANPEQDIASAIMDYVAPAGEPSRMPIAAVTGSKGKTSTCDMLAGIMSAAGHRVGLGSSIGITIDGERIVSADMAGSAAAQAILRDPDVDAAVLETAHSTLLTQGIGYGSCDVAAVLNVGEHQIGVDGIDSLEALARCQRLVAESARDTVVLNADDGHCLSMRGHLQAPRLCLVTRQARNRVVADHIAGGGFAACIDTDDAIPGFRLVDGGEDVFSMQAAHIPATRKGRETFSLINATYAAAIAYALGKPADAIRAGLTAFELQPDS